MHSQDKTCQALRPSNRTIALVIGNDPDKFPKQGNGSYVPALDDHHAIYEDRYLEIAKGQESIAPPFHLHDGTVRAVKNAEGELVEISLPGWRTHAGVSVDEQLVPMVDFEYLRANGGPNFVHANWGTQQKK